MMSQRHERRSPWWRLMGFGLLGAVFCGASAAAFAGGRTGLAAALGATVAAIVQLVAVRSFLTDREQGAVAMLVAVARGAMVRVVGGAALCLGAIVWTPLDPVGFVYGFVAQYVVLETACDVVALRALAPDASKAGTPRLADSRF